jgi:hypothetical protein
MEQGDKPDAPALLRTWAMEKRAAWLVLRSLLLTSARTRHLLSA